MCRWIQISYKCYNSASPCLYRQQKAYIATQGPLAETTEDYWRMLWEHNSTIVVMLTKLREMGRVRHPNTHTHTRSHNYTLCAGVHVRSGRLY